MLAHQCVACRCLHELPVLTSAPPILRLQGNTGNNNKGQGNTGDSNNGAGNTGAFNNGDGNTGANNNVS